MPFFEPTVRVSYYPTNKIRNCIFYITRITEERSGDRAPLAKTITRRRAIEFFTRDTNYSYLFLIWLENISFDIAALISY
jgi:hypothetical protein